MKAGRKCLRLPSAIAKCMQINCNLKKASGGISGQTMKAYVSLDNFREVYFVSI